MGSICAGSLRRPFLPACKPMHFCYAIGRVWVGGAGFTGSSAPIAVGEGNTSTDGGLLHKRDVGRVGVIATIGIYGGKRKPLALCGPLSRLPSKEMTQLIFCGNDCIEATVCLGDASTESGQF